MEFASSTADTPVAELEPGTVVGKYVVVGDLGRGGMAVVYAGYDPQLDRRVALKLLWRERSGAAEAAAKARMLREARAMAQIGHPNVIGVHEVGTHEGRIWIAMELIEGDTLKGWLTAKRRRWPQVLRVMRRAGLGLEAAHDAGMLHRDFKPDNVMIDGEGRVRVLDFGLVRAQGSSDERQETGEVSQRDAVMTATGDVLGTPAYMSPEQMRGEALDARSDQFSFFATLWEALYGERPFRGRTLVELQSALELGEPEQPRSRRGVPRWLHEVCLRGVSPVPGRRFADMRAALEALEQGSARVWRRRVVAGVGLVAVLGAVGYGLMQRADAAAIARCEADGEAFDAVWNEEARAGVRASLLATGVTFAATTADRVTDRLDAHAEAWRHTATQACLAGRVHARWEKTTLDRAQWCLEDQRLELEFMVDQLTTADELMVPRAIPAIAAVRAVERCADAAALASGPSPPPTQLRPTLAGLRRELAEVRALFFAGRYSRGLALVHAAATRAEAIAWPPMSNALKVLEADLRFQDGDVEGSNAAARAAYDRGFRTRSWATAASAAVRLSHNLGYTQVQLDEGAAWAKHAEIAIERAGDPLNVHRVALATALTGAYVARGDGAKAMPHAERAFALSRDGLGEAHPQTARALNNLGQIQLAVDDVKAARKSMERGLELKRVVFGDDHPSIANSLSNLATAAARVGKLQESREFDEQALAIRTSALGSDHPDVASSLRSLAITASELGDLEEADRLAARALQILEASLGPQHPYVARLLNTIANNKRRMGRNVEAEAMYRRALQIMEANVGAETATYANVLNNLGVAVLNAGRLEEALEIQERALALREQILSPDAIEIATSLQNIAAVKGASGSSDGVEGMLLRALQIRESKLGPNHRSLTTVLASLGNVKRRAGDYEDAQALFRRALSILDHEFGKEHPTVAETLCDLASLEQARGRDADALASLERAVAIFSRISGAQEREAEARFALARQLVKTKGDRRRALALAGQARDAWRGVGDTPKADEATTWIEEASR